MQICKKAKNIKYGERKSLYVFLSNQEDLIAI